MQVVTGGVAVEIRPELINELIAVQPVRRFQGQQLDQRLRLAQPPRAVGDRPVTLGDLETTQEPDSHCRCPAPLGPSPPHYEQSKGRDRQPADCK